MWLLDWRGGRSKPMLRVWEVLWQTGSKTRSSGLAFSGLIYVWVASFPSLCWFMCRWSCLLSSSLLSPEVVVSEASSWSSDLRSGQAVLVSLWSDFSSVVFRFCFFLCFSWALRFMVVLVVKFFIFLIYGSCLAIKKNHLSEWTLLLNILFSTLWYN